MNEKFLLKIFILMLLGICNGFKVNAQDSSNMKKTTSYTPYWYVGAGYESPFIYGDMYSITDEKINWGVGPNIRLGYRFNSFFGFELKGLYGIMTGMSSKPSARYWLGSDGMTYYPYTLLDGTEYTPEYRPKGKEDVFFGIWENNKLGISGTRYEDALSRVHFFQLALLGNMNLNRLFMETPTNRDQRFTLSLKPGVYANKYISAGYSTSDESKRITPKYVSPISLGLGGEIGLNWAITQRIGVEIYSGIMWVSDQNFDGIRTIKNAKDDFIYSLGVHFNIKFPKDRKESHPVAAPLVIVAPAPATVKESLATPKPELFDTFELSLFVPKIGVLKEKNITENTPFQFPLSSTDLVPTFADNQLYLNRIDASYRKLSGDESINLTSIRIEGFASPEGPHDLNVMLANNRAKSITDYLRSKYGYHNISYQGQAENWDGLRKALQTWDAPGKEVLIKIVDSQMDPEAKKTALKACGTIYKKAIAEIYPSLRMNRCVFTFEIKPYTLEQCITIFNSAPEKLSADEMVAVANVYPLYSENFVATIKKALSYYPRNTMLLCYKSAILLHRNHASEALKYLNEADQNDSTVLLLKGIAYAKLHDYANAESFLNKAKSMGNADAEKNLKIFISYQNK